MTNTGLEAQKAKLESNHLVESVKVEGSKSNPKLVAIPTDAHAKWQLDKKQWESYSVYVEVQG